MMLLEYKPWGASAPHAIGDTITTTYMYDVYSYNHYTGGERLWASYRTLELANDKIRRIKLQGRNPYYKRRAIC